MFILRAHSILYCILLSLCLFSVASFASAAPVIEPVEPFDENAWHRTLPPAFAWDLPEDVHAVAVEVGTSTAHEPLFVYEPPIRQYSPSADEIKEGEQYLAVQFKDASGWGDIGYYAVRIDRTPPTNVFVDIVHETRATSTLVFGAEDALSGIAGYAVHINGNPPFYVRAEDARYGYSFVHRYPGKFDVLVIAYDRAGNTAATRFPIFVLDQSPAAADLWFGAFTDTHMAVGLLAALAFAASWYAFRTRRFYRTKERRLRDEMYEIQEQMGKIFAALRDEIYDQIEGIRNRSRMTKNEKHVVENLNRALEVSETLVEREVEDVKKMLK